jgi:hypothetical protein
MSSPLSRGRIRITMPEEDQEREITMKLLQFVGILVLLGAGGELLKAQMPPVVLRLDLINFVRL